MNLYAYVGGNPINWVDRNGLIPTCDYELTGDPWKHYTGNTRTEDDIIKTRTKIFPPHPFTKPSNKPKDYFSIYKIVVYKVEWTEAEYETKQARLWVCYDECGNKVYEGWAPSTVLGTDWEKVKGSERITDDRFRPSYDVEFGL